MSLKSFVARIEAENELFNSMSKAEKRVKIAEDCLERIKLSLIEPKTGSFIKYETREILKLKSDIKATVNTSIQCEACAKGSLFLSYVGRVNNFESCQLQERNKIEDNEHRKLLEIFTARQLSLIEIAFEGSQHLDNDLNNNSLEFKNSEYNKARSYYYHYYYDVPQRMIAICENIIKNKGTFKPLKLEHI